MPNYSTILHLRLTSTQKADTHDFPIRSYSNASNRKEVNRLVGVLQDLRPTSPTGIDFAEDQCGQEDSFLLRWIEIEEYEPVPEALVNDIIEALGGGNGMKSVL